MTLGSAIGALLIGPMSSTFPRTWCIGIGSVVLLVSIVVQATTTTLPALYVARILVGVGNGIVQTYCVIYIQETAPAHLRSLSSGILQSFLSVGTLIGTVSEIHPLLDHPYRTTTKPWLCLGSRQRNRRHLRAPLLPDPAFRHARHPRPLPPMPPLPPRVPALAPPAPKGRRGLPLLNSPPPGSCR